MSESFNRLLEEIERRKQSEERGVLSDHSLELTGQDSRRAGGCPDAEDICAFVEGGGSIRRCLEIFFHVYLRRCRHCRKQVKDLVAALRVIRSDEPITLVEVFERARLHNKTHALNFKRDGEWQSISSDELIARARNIALGLYQLGVRRGHPIALLAENSPEWTLTDAGSQFLGAVDIPIHPREETEKVGAILRKTKPGVLFIQDRAAFERIKEEVDFGTLKYIVFFSEAGAEEVAALTLAKLEERGRELGREHPHLSEELAREVLPHDPATIIHTSGTTGEPKGVILSHSNLVNNITACADQLAPNKKDVSLSLLPLSHALERIAMYVYLYRGLSVYYAEPINLDCASASSDLCATLRDVKPTVMVGVPRMFEKIYAGIKARPAKEWRAELGGRVRLFISGDETLPERIERDFTRARIPIVQGYGLTETSPVIAVGTLNKRRRGTVGRPLKGVEIKISEYGEILTRGACVLLGYFNDVEMTLRAFTPDGWFRTGDLGKLHKGYLIVTGRMIETIITAEGLTLSPQQIEHGIKESLFVNEVVVKQVCSSNGRPSLVAMVVPDFEQVRAFAELFKIKANTQRELCDHPQIRQLIRSEVDARTKELMPGEGVERIALSPEEFTHHQGDFTINDKHKRDAAFDNRYHEWAQSAD
jgi:long-chain acyl-CoA synthetase